MADLLKFEFHKLFRRKALYICGGVLALFSILTAIIAKIAANAEIGLLLGTAGTGVTLMQSSLSSGIFSIVTGIFVSICACEDYGNGAIRSVYAKGYSRVDVYFSKWIVMIVTALVYCLISWFTSFAVGSILLEVGSADSTLVGCLLVQLLVVIAYASFFFAFSVILRKLGGAIPLNVVVPNVMSTVFQLIDIIILNAVVRGGNLDPDKIIKVSDYWLDGMLTSTSGADSLLSAITGEGRLPSDPQECWKRLIVYMVIAIVYAAVFTVAGVFTERKRDV